MQDESRTQGQPLPVSAARRRMDFAPVHSASRTAAPLPTDRELERRKLARQEMARREAIKQQIEEQNRLKSLNQRRIDAARQELSEYQAAEEARNRALEGERQRILERQRQAQLEAAEQMAARRKAMELEAKKRLQAEQIRKQRALLEMQRREEASKLAAAKRAPLKPRQTTPFFAQKKSQSINITSDSDDLGSRSHIPMIATSAASASSVASAASAAPVSSTAATLHSTATLRPAGDTKVLPSSRIQVIASPSRKLFGRIRPAGPTRQTQPEVQLETQSQAQAQSIHSVQLNQSRQAAEDDSDDLEELLMSAFDEPSEKKTPVKTPVKTSVRTPVKTPAKTPEENLAKNFAQKSAHKTSMQSSEKILESLDSIPDTSENNMNYVLGGRSPFINTDKIVKRPLSDSTRENATRFDDQNDNTSVSSARPRKNVYEKRDHSKKAVKKSTTMIVEDRPKGIGISLAIAITLMIILGTIVGAFVYFAFFQ